MAGWPLFVYPKYFCLQNKPAEHRSHPSDSLNRQDRTARIAQIDGDNFEDEIKSRKLDVTKLQNAYGVLKELFSIDYGVPTIKDGKLQENLEYLELIASSDELKNEEVMLYCQTSVWETARTYATLSITPGPLGSRQLVAKFWSRAHEHLFPGDTAQ